MKFLNNILLTKLNVIVLFLVSLFTFTILILLHKNLLPTVFADEWVYSSSARLLPFSQSTVSSYLYLLFLKSTNYCGENFLFCNRVINALLFVMATPFIYLISSKISTPTTSLYIAILSLLSPINSYTAYFMPEAMYFFVFWLFAWFVLTRWNTNVTWYAIIAGFLLAILSLIKIHAIFILPSMIVLLWYSSTSLKYLGSKYLSIFCLIMTLLLTHSLLGYLIAGMNGLSIFGEKYSVNLLAALDINRLIFILKFSFIPLLGHFLALFALFSIPLIVMFKQIFSLNMAKQPITFINVISLFSFTILISLVLVTTFITTQITGWDIYNSLDRLHLRYYNFIFPLFLIISSSAFNFEIVQSKVSKLIVGIIFFLVSVLTVWLLPRYNISFIDCPELFGLIYNASVFKFIILLLFSCNLLCLWNTYWGTRGYLFFIVPMMFLIANYYVTKELYTERYYNQDSYDIAGQFTHKYLNKDTSSLEIIGSERAGLFKTLFYVDNPKTNIIELPNHTPLMLAKISTNIRWILLIGDYPLYKEPVMKIAGNGYTLIKIR